MAPRVQLQRAWLVLRILFFACAIGSINGVISPASHGELVVVHGHYADISTAACAMSASFILAAIVVAPRLRGRLLAYLGSLGASGSKEQAAASVAALIGNRRSAAESLAVAVEHFRALQLSSLTEQALRDNAPDHSLHAKTERATLGAVHAFVSHSWSDDGGAKFGRLHSWAAGDGSKLLWLDKVCIQRTSRKASRSACTPTA